MAILPPQCDAVSIKSSMLPCSWQTQYQLLLTIYKSVIMLIKWESQFWFKLKCQGDLSVLNELCVLFPSKRDKEFTDEFMVLNCQIIVMLDIYIFFNQDDELFVTVVYHYQMEFCSGKYFISRQALLINLDTCWEKYACFSLWFCLFCEILLKVKIKVEYF